MSDLFTDNHRWGDYAQWQRDALALHAGGPIHRIEAEGFDPFWAVIGNDAVMDIERQHELFTAAPETVLINRKGIEAREHEIKTLVHMDAPQHGKYRKLTLPWFKPRSLDRLAPRLEELSAEALQKMVDADGEIDFAVEVALPYPLRVILEILGLPEDDYARMLMLTQQMFGQEDPDLQREPPSPEVIAEVLMDFYTYFAGITEQRRENPTDDLATLIANGQIDGEAMPDLETMGYYVIIASAGHDTTSNAMSGGMRALVENPDQLAKLQADPQLMNNAVEEMIRFTAPVRHFMRTAQDDAEVAGQKIAKGDWLYLSYTAANVDPQTFEDPLRFDITRPNADRNIAFGYGVHFCLGAQLARMELRSMFNRIIPAIDSIELAGEPADSKTTFVGGLKTLPIRYTLKV